jgi:hypothetical protein
MLKSASRRLARILCVLVSIAVLASSVGINVAYADTGARTESVISGGETWKYLDSNVDPWLSTLLHQAASDAGMAAAVGSYRYLWSAPAEDYSVNLGGYELSTPFDDSSWSSGASPFAYKNSGTASEFPGATEVNGNIAGTSNRVQTYFFRLSFALSDPSWAKSAS